MKDKKTYSAEFIGKSFKNTLKIESSEPCEPFSLRIPVPAVFNY